MKKLIFVIFYILFLHASQAQSYEQLVDMTGYDVPTEKITQWADSLKANLPEEIGSNFKVVDFGYYLHNAAQGVEDQIFNSIDGLPQYCRLSKFINRYNTL